MPTNSDHDQLQSSGASEQPEAMGKTMARPGGRLVAHWQRLVCSQMPFSSDQARADRLNQIAQEQGWDYSCTRLDFSRLRLALVGIHVPDLAESPRQECDSLVVLRQLIRQFGKEGVKQLIDSL
jgi:hypothetical protein